MKNLILALLLSVLSPVLSLGADLTNGVFYIDNPIVCHLVSQNGSTATNHLSAGSTYMVGNVLLEMNITNKTMFYFSGGPMIEVGPKSAISINLFDQEVKNLDSQPRKAEFGSHNLVLNFGIGEFVIIYPNQNLESSMTISTPFISYQINGGKYLIRISDKSVIAFPLEGTIQMHGDKNIESIDKGKLAVAIPFGDLAKTITSRPITPTPEQLANFSSPIINAEKKWNNVQFFVLGGRVIGILIK